MATRSNFGGAFLLLPLIALLCGTAQAQNQTCHQVCSVPGCASLNTTCLNGGYFNGDGDCPPASISCPVASADAMWKQKQGCKCPNGYSGLDCGLPSESTCTNQGLLFDTSYYNPNVTIPLQCFVDHTDNTDYFSFRDSRVDVTITGSRMTVILHTRVPYTPTGGGPVTCSPQYQVIHCELGNCTATRTVRANAVTLYPDLTYSCTDRVCRSLMPDSPNSDLHTAYTGFVAGMGLANSHTQSPTIDLDIQGITSNGTATATFKTVIQLPLHCTSAVCAKTLFTVPSAKASTSNTGPIVVTAVIGAIVGIGVVLVAGLSLTSSSPGVLAGAKVSSGSGSGGKSEPKTIAVAQQSQPPSSGLEMSSFSKPADVAVAIKADGGGAPQFHDESGAAAAVFHFDGGIAAAGAAGAGAAADSSPATASPSAIADSSSGSPILAATPALIDARVASDSKSPFVGGTSDVEFAFSNINYVLPAPDGMKPRQVLTNMSGVVRSGEMLAIIGPSGSGKTSLLDILARRPRNGHVSGAIVARSGSSAQQPVLGYVTQNDFLFPTETVREALSMSAYLRAPDPTHSEARVQSVMEAIGLDNIAESYIGNHEALGGEVGGGGGAISGGERRRTSIGIELVTSPDLLLLDEPTSGLDSNNAATVLRVLHSVSQHGRACVFSIHQCPASLFGTFSRVLVLTRQGRQMYFGSPAEIPAYLNSIGHPLPQNVSAPEFLMDLATSQAAEQLANAWQSSQLARNLEQAVTQRCADAPKLESGAHPLQRRHPLRSSLSQFARIFGRRFRQMSRSAIAAIGHSHSRGDSADASSSAAVAAASSSWSVGRALRAATSVMLMHTWMAIVMGIIIGAIFYQIDNEIPGIQNRGGLLFFIVVYWALTGLSALPVFITSRAAFNREVFMGYYSVGPYFWAEVLADLLPLRVLPPIAFSLIAYWMIGLQNDADKLLIFLGFSLLSHILSTVLCLFISAASSSFNQANFIAVLYLIFAMIFGGYVLNANTNANNASFLRYLSTFFYPYDALMVNELTGLLLNFNPSGLPSVSFDGTVILSNFGLDNFSLKQSGGTMIGLLVAFLLLTYGSLHFRLHAALQQNK